jgi:hypothetical protein
MMKGLVDTVFHYDTAHCGKRSGQQQRFATKHDPRGDIACILGEVLAF